MEEYEKLKREVSTKISEIEENEQEKSSAKLNKIKNVVEQVVENQENKKDEENIDKHIKQLERVNERLSGFQRFKIAFEKNLDIDPGRLMGLTDGIFGMVMTLLIFGMGLPEFQISNYSGFLNFVSSLAPTIGITLVSFILLASFWICHHEFIKINNLNMPYLWFNIFFLASISFIPFTTSIVGNYSHFFLANVIFGANVFLTIAFFLIMYYYAYKRGFLEDTVSKEKRKYINHTLYIIMGFTILINLLDFNVSHNFIYLFFLIPLIFIIRDTEYKIKYADS